MATLQSSWAPEPLDLTESLNDEVWTGSYENQMEIPGGFLWAKNDAEFLYMAVDFVEDTQNDPGTGDYFWLTFDTNRNRAITPNSDINYGVYPNQPNKMGKQLYLGPGRWTGLLNTPSDSACRYDFGASPNSTTPHRIWKLKLDLSELNVSLATWWYLPYTFFGLRIHSSAPNLNYDTPANFYTSFSNLHRIQFSRKPTIAQSLQGPEIGSVGLIPATQIDTTTGRATTASTYYVKTNNHAFGGTLNLIGNRLKMQAVSDMAGSQYYRVLHREGTSGSFENFTSGWTNYRLVDTNYIPVNIAPNSDGYYFLYNPSSYDFSIDDLLMQFDSRLLATGLHQFQVEFYSYGSGTYSKVSNAIQTLTLYIDNNVPQVSIDAIMHGSQQVNACGIVNLNGNTTGGIKVKFDAYDGEGNLLSYNVYAKYGEGHTQSLRSATHADSGIALWQGANNLEAPSSGVYIPPVTCAYSFNVVAHARTTNGYGQIGHNSASRFITILK
ncbi:hypothetical protein [Leeuwenhoekiella parthenopeia]|uniref:Uncharacterized protein n=1 Tax=Leeuwenhoekiella parthenopeia TaxID=2890320 RepID=A0ABS8GP80_9FLAO|nr:hypothetical protein [Leeuwenhoekiella parthenopeia]MCC4211571.1 hypothetical protein [Leeuwenhoekiella parthenopeia]